METPELNPNVAPITEPDATGDNVPLAGDDENATEIDVEATTETEIEE